tara:strand:+ start:311 stop:421 length:111 start_codon:yes stop_codon:yes gene_type:complete
MPDLKHSKDKEFDRLRELIEKQTIVLFVVVVFFRKK